MACVAGWGFPGFAPAGVAPPPQRQMLGHGCPGFGLRRRKGRTMTTQPKASWDPPAGYLAERPQLGNRRLTRHLLNDTMNSDSFQCWQVGQNWDPEVIPEPPGGTRQDSFLRAACGGSGMDLFSAMAASRTSSTAPLSHERRGGGRPWGGPPGWRAFPPPPPSAAGAPGPGVARPHLAPTAEGGGKA